MAKRQFVSFPFSDLYKIKQQVLNWSARFGTCCFLDNQFYVSDDPGYECVVAVGEKARLKTEAGNAFSELRLFSLEHNDWLFGHFSFDLKSETEQTASLLPDFIQFPGLFFFVPEIVLLIHAHEIEIGLFTNDHRQLLDEIENHVTDAGKNIPSLDEKENLTTDSKKNIPPPVLIQNRISKADYIQVIERLQQHILRGDCYEINFCQEFFVEGASLDPIELYWSLTRVSPNPFSAYYTADEKFLLCASPERFLKRKGDLVLSQPIKGTSARNLHDKKLDETLRASLAASEKDRAENVMVVDLVRNDLSKICERDTVRVTELFGIYSFPQVHQMISTITGRPMKDLHWSEMIARTFPMGSMTGAPKKRVLELIERYEKTKRGLFSGSVGYVKPNQDFDFNVVIRSMLYNRPAQHLSYFAGSGITMNSDPENEYEECLLKVAAFENIIKNPSRF
jgi:para-aminobenzoate synthetase component 1